MIALPRNPFRFGVLGYPSSDNLITLPHQAEDLGYDVFHHSDHIFNFAPITGMAVAAQATSKIRIGSNVLANDFWHPAILAREALALDCISNGRLEFGLGSGFYFEDYKQTGVPMDSPGVRISRLEESIQIIKGLLCGETVTFHGKYYNVKELSLAMKPVQKPHPPIFIGGGSQRILSIAARQADIVGFNVRTTQAGGIDPISLTLEATQQKVDWVVQAAGERLPALELSVLAGDTVVTDSQDLSIAKVIEQWSYWGGSYTKEQVLESPPVLVGDVEQIADKLIQNRERFGFSYYVVFDNAMENFGPVVKRLVGT